MATSDIVKYGERNVNVNKKLVLLTPPPNLSNGKRKIEGRWPVWESVKPSSPRNHARARKACRLGLFTPGQSVGCATPLGFVVTVILAMRTATHGTTRMLRPRNV